MNTGNQISTNIERKTPDTHVIEVKVNKILVEFLQRRVTGLEIKETAIAQGVTIQPDFILFQILGPGQRKVIGDDDLVTLRKSACFEAIPCDDNS